MAKVSSKVENPNENENGLIIREIKQKKQNHHLKMQSQPTINITTSSTGTTVLTHTNNKLVLPQLTAAPSYIAPSGGHMPAPKLQPQPQPQLQPPPHSKPKHKSYLPRSRCGEIFVTNNARQWTFICTYCNKSTRDIGDFICHIKMRHLVASDDSYTESDSDTDIDGNLAYGPDQDVSNHYASNNAHGVRTLVLNSSKAIEIIPINRETAPMRRNAVYPLPPLQPLAYKSAISISQLHSKRRTTAEGAASEYLDCSNYLDVNVVTEPDELNYNGQTPPGGLAISRIISRPERQVQVPKYNDNRMHESTMYERNNEVTANGIAQNESQNGEQISVANATIKHENLNGETTEEGLDCNEYGNTTLDEQHPEYGNEEMDSQNHYTQLDDEEDEDFDNQLLIAPGDSEAASGSEIKTKRRQIRGTAYCALCNKTFQYYSLYRNHMIKHSNETPFKCGLCKKGFKSKQAIRYHMHTHQKEKQFKCTLCDAAYYTENQFITHLLTHENGTTFPCMVCGTILHSDKERDLHLTSHTEERPYRCEYCNKLFRLRHHLSNHLKMHRQYRCDYCKEEFPSAVHLRKPYACPSCDSLPEVRAHVDAIRGAVGASSIGCIEPNSSQMSQSFEGLATQQVPVQSTDLTEMETDSDEEDDDEENESQNDDTGFDSNSNSKKRFTCRYCGRSYAHLSGLNFHIRNKHY